MICSFLEAIFGSGFCDSKGAGRKRRAQKVLPQKGVFGESIVLSAPLSFSDDLRANLKGAEFKKR